MGFSPNPADPLSYHASGHPAGGGNSGFLEGSDGGARKCLAEVYQPSPRIYAGLGELDYPFHDKSITVTSCGRICMLRKKINLSTVLAGQTLGIKEVD